MLKSVALQECKVGNGQLVIKSFVNRHAYNCYKNIFIFSALSFKEISLKNYHHCGGGGGKGLVLMVYIFKSSLFRSSFVLIPSLVRRAICRDILRELLIFIYS